MIVELWATASRRAKTLTAATVALAALPVLRDRLHPDKTDPRWLADRIADLSAADFEARERATDGSKRVAVLVEDELRQAERQTTSPEAHRRLGEVLATVRTVVLSADGVRVVRAVAVLERIGSGEVRAVLKTPADGPPGAVSTREAKAALERLRSR